MNCFFVGIAGGSGSGKTFLTRELLGLLGPDQAVAIETDAYYRDLSHLPIADRARVNFDHPDALETELLVTHLRTLAKGEKVRAPVYDFTTHARTPETREIMPRPFVLVEGVLVLAMTEMAPCLDFSVFLDVPADIRLIRRLRRDTAQRGRTLDQVLDQYLEKVRPMHEQFVSPSRNLADRVLEGDFRATDLAEEIRAAAGLKIIARNNRL